MAKLKPMKDEKELAAVPTDQPVLVVLEPPVTSEIEAEPQDKRGKVDRETPDGEDGAALLKTQLEASEAARAASDKRANDATALATQRELELTEARAQSADSETEAVASGLAAAQADAAAAKAAVKEAFEAGDAGKLADAQERMGRAGADIREFERAAATLADRKARDDKAAKERPIEKQSTDINETIDRMQLLPAERTWLKAHPEALMDRSRNVELDAAYIKATRKGLTRGTPKYFEFIEAEMGYAEPETADTDEAEERTTIVAAPVSRDNRSSLPGYQNNRVVLTPEQREFARTMGLSDVKYAEQVLALKKDKQENPEKYAARG